jgi:polysaccharide pyruvyl transferase WcaK-like protein
VGERHARPAGDRPRVAVLWAEPHSTNLGVQVLSRGTEALLRRVWPTADIVFQGYGPGDAPIRVGHHRTVLRNHLSSHSPLATWMRGFDLVVDMRGGDSFADIYGLRRLVTMTALGELATRAGVPVVLGPQTIGPFDGVRGRLLARLSLRHARSVMARDPVSAEVAAGLGRRADVLTTDVVFALPQPVPDGRRDVVVNVSGLLWQPNPHVDASAYRRTVQDLCLRLAAEGRRPTLLAHVLDTPQADNAADNDVPAVHAAAEATGLRPEVVVPESLDHVRAVLASAEVVVASRMHACLNALSVGRPAVALAYSRKFAPLMTALDWPFTVDLRTAPAPVDEVLAAVSRPDLAARAEQVRHHANRLLGGAEEQLRQLLPERAAAVRT